MSRRVAFAILVVAVIPSALIAFYSRDMPSFGWIHDDGLYFVCAKSLAQGAGYRILSLPGEPFQTKYPPLYPLALSLVWMVNPRFPDNLPLAAALSWVFLPVLLVLAWRLLPSLGVSRREGAVVCILLGLNPLVILYSVSLMSELPFCCVLFGCFLLILRAGRPESRWWVAAAAGALGAAAYLTRNAGIPLLIAAPLWLLWRRRFTAAGLFFVLMAMAVVGWTLWTRAHVAGGANLHLLYYTDYMGYHFANFSISETPFVFWENIQEYFPGIGALFALPLGIGGLKEDLFLSVVAVVTLFAVIRLAVRNGLHPYHFFAALYVALLLPWMLCHNDRAERLLFPVLPLLLAGVVAEFAQAWRRLVARVSSGSELSILAAAPALAVLGFVALLCGMSWISINCHFPAFMEQWRSEVGETRRAYEWIKARVPPGRTLLAETDPIVYLYTGRRAWRLTVPPRVVYKGKEGDVTRFIASAPEVARAQGASYLVYHTTAKGHVMNGEVVDPPSGLPLVYQASGTAIYALD